MGMGTGGPVASQGACWDTSAHTPRSQAPAQHFPAAVPQHQSLINCSWEA